MGFQLVDKIAVEDEGDGDAVVCVHGLGGTSNTWTPLMGALSRHRVIRMDLPGSGRSHAAASAGPLSIARWVDAMQAVCARLGIARADAMKHVWGYTIVNDVTARDVQMRHQQWDLGKSFDSFCPMGPWIVGADEFDVRASRVRGWVTPKGGSAELRQDAPTKDMIHDVATLIETCSRGITLYPGDVIATGTPAGVGIGFKPPKFLKRGDVVAMEVDGIGRLTNPVK